MKGGPLVEFLIPTYKRPKGALRAAMSIASQIHHENMDKVRIWIRDDSTPGISTAEFKHTFRPLSKEPYVRVTRNKTNLGMSLNILSMVIKTAGKYWTVLTDDDYLNPSMLDRVLEAVRHAKRESIHSIITPRYGYTEDGSLHTIDCRMFTQRSMIIESGPINAVRYMRNGYILTGAIFDSRLSTALWERNADNGYFCAINYGDSLLQGRSQYLDEPWFHHTVLNETYWEAWGKTRELQNSKLLHDYLEAQRIIYAVALMSCESGGLLKMQLIGELVAAQLRYLLDRARYKGFLNSMFHYKYPWQLRAWYLFVATSCWLARHTLGAICHIAKLPYSKVIMD